MQPPAQESWPQGETQESWPSGQISRGSTVVYADERREQRPVTDVTIEIGNLATRTEAIVGPAGSQVLIGQLVLEALDLIADCRNRTLTPRHPEGPGPGPALTRRAATTGPASDRCLWHNANAPRTGMDPIAWRNEERRELSCPASA